MSAFKPTTLVGENTDLLVLLLYHVVVSKCSYLYFRSDKVKSYVYDIKVIKLVLGEAVCKDLLFLHAFTGCDSVSRVFGIRKKSAFQRIIRNEKAMKDWSNVFSVPKQGQYLVETNGCRAIVALFNADQRDPLAYIRYDMLCKRVAGAKNIRHARLPPITSA